MQEKLKSSIMLKWICFGSKVIPNEMVKLYKESNGPVLQYNKLNRLQERVSFL